MAKVVLVSEGGREVSCDVASSPVLIGRSSRCNLVVRSARLSRLHAIIEPNSAGALLKDLESRNGIRVNGKACKEHLLKDGDKFELGDVTGRFEA